MDYFLKLKYKAIEIVNEVILLLLSYHFLLSYQIVTEGLGKNFLSHSMVTCLSALFLFNISMLIVKLMSKLILAARKKYYARRNARIVKEREEAKWESIKLQEQANVNYLEQ